ncbi:MAG: hypothetical protein OXG16_08990 [Rhodospirillales bacterium]|nr:hypothetical protein [Rhodospirillales bacterium]
MGAEDGFGRVATGELARAAPNGASQSFLVDGDSLTADEMSVRVVRDDGPCDLAHAITDGARLMVQVPFLAPCQGFQFAAFTGLIPGIEPDLSSYPHDVLGMRAWEGEAGRFWRRSPSVLAYLSQGRVGFRTLLAAPVGRISIRTWQP